MSIESAVQQLLERSHRLGADPRNTNFAGGNTSAKQQVKDPLTSELIQVMWVKGSGGDLATLKAEGLSVLRLDRLAAMVAAYEGEHAEDEMVALFDYCRFGTGGAPPSIDTAMHGLVGCSHVDHLHPDAVIALATASEGEALTKECFGDRVAWVPWRRPGFQLGLDIAKLQAQRPELIGCVLGGHGMTAWGASSAQCEEHSLWMIRTAEAFLARRSRPDPFGEPIEAMAPLGNAQRHERAAELAPVIRSLASTDHAVVGAFSDAPVILEFLKGRNHPELAGRGSSCPDHFLRTKIRPLVVDLPPTAPFEDVRQRLADLHAQYRDEYESYYRRYAGLDTPAMRGADPVIFLVPGIGMFSFGRDAQTARVAGEFFVNTVNAIKGAEGVSTYRPVPESEKFRIEYWGLEEAKLRRMPPPAPLACKIALVTGGASGIGRATARRLASLGACVVVADLQADGAEEVAAELRELNGRDSAIAVGLDVTDEASVGHAVRAGLLRYAGLDIVVSSAGIASSAPIAQTSLQEWERNYAVLAKGYFLVAREAFRVLAEQGMGGSIVFVASKNALVAGKNASAYSSAKAAELHLARCLAEEGGSLGIRVNTVNPDAVIAGSSIWSSNWKSERAASYGIAEEELEQHYRGRTTLGVSIYPEDVAEAIAFLAGPASAKSTGNILNVDGGVSAAYPR